MTGNQLVRKFVLRNNHDAELFYTFLKLNRGPMNEQGRVLQVVVSEHKEGRTDAVNRYMWAGLLTPISEQAWVNGQRFTAEVWAEFFKAQFLPETTSRGTEKWQYLPDSSRQLVGSTTHLNKTEMTLYLQQIEHYAVDELGVLLPINPNQEP